ncbi:SGNH/GDSL hydrolase family protein [Oceaniserpentilla sp. 4NH20-0058]|uniref:SGNH/GDSL hydrolase family protein n=1 Tax=Oceaniserpentilla sp. 4NH20-0058 TaxID=3127660 RepID=UPI00310A0962
MKLSTPILQWLWYLSSPIFLLSIPQALYLKKTALRLPEATGNNTLYIGDPDTYLKILHIGESTVAGVGVETLSQGISHHLTHELHINSNGQGFHCHMQGNNGIRMTELNHHLSKYKGTADLAIVTMGVNDTTGLTSLKTWKTEIQKSIKLLRQKGAQHIFFMQVPPMAKFPALPAPLKYLLGLRAALLDKQLRITCESQNCVHYVCSELPISSEFMAIDGYHPNELGYKTWAQQIAPQILKHLR